MHVSCITQTCLEPYGGWIQTHSKKQRPRHGLAQTKTAPNDARLSCGKTQIHAQAVGQRWQLFITIDVRIHNKTQRLSLLQSVLLKGELLSSPPSCCSLSSLGNGRLWWLMHSPRGSQTENLEFLRKCFLPIGDSLTQYLQSGASLENKKREENIKILDARLLGQPPLSQ